MINLSRVLLKYNISNSKSFISSLNKVTFISKLKYLKKNNKVEPFAEEKDDDCIILENESKFNDNDKLNIFDQQLTYINNECSGCGIALQVNDEKSLGYIPINKIELSKKEEISKLICERCYKLQNYGQYDNKTTNKAKQTKEIEHLRSLKLSNVIPNTDKYNYYSILDKIDASKLIKSLGNRLSKYSQVFYLLDIIDLESSLNQDVIKLLQEKQSGIVFIINKFDILPEKTSYERLNIYCGERIKDYLKTNNFNIKYSYIIISSKTGTKMEYVISKIKQMKNYYKENQIYFGKPKIFIIGNCNVGKSSFINKLTEKLFLSKNKHKKEADEIFRKKVKQEQKDLIKESKSKETKINIDKEEEEKEDESDRVNIEDSNEDEEEQTKLTCSAIPGTTLDINKINSIKYGCVFFDTPGFPSTGSYITKLYKHYEALVSISIKSQLKSILLNFKQGYSIFFGSLARIDMINGEDKIIACYVSDNVTIHKTQTINIDTLWDNQSGILLRPKVVGIDQVNFKKHIFSLDCDKYSILNHDIVISGLGWISISGKGFCQIEVNVPEDIKVYKRSGVLCPYEPRNNKVKKLFGKTVNISSKKNSPIFKSFQRINSNEANRKSLI